MIVKGAPETAVAALAEPAPLMRWCSPCSTMARRPLPISRAEDQRLEPRRPHLLARAGALAPPGLGAGRLAITPLGATTAQAAALKTKQIDGMIVEVNAGYRLEEEKSGRVLVQFGDLLKTFHIYLLYAHSEFAAKNPAAVRAFLTGWFETIDWMQKNRERTIDIVRRTSDVSLALATRDYDELQRHVQQDRPLQPGSAQGAFRARLSRWACCRASRM